MDLEKVLEFIRRAEIGRKIVSKLESELEVGLIRLVKLDPAKHPFQIRTGRPAGGFDFRGTYGIIYHEAISDVRLLAPILLHEFAHAADEEYRAGYELEQALRKELAGLADQVLLEASQRLSRVPETIAWEDVGPIERQALRTAQLRYERFWQNRLLKAEQKAYLASKAWVEQVCARDPEYRVFLSAQSRLGYVFDQMPTDDEIKSAYGLKHIA